MGLDSETQCENGEWKNNAEFECRDHQLKICKEWAFNHLECIKVEIGNGDKAKPEDELGNQDIYIRMFSNIFFIVCQFLINNTLFDQMQNLKSSSLELIKLL